MQKMDPGRSQGWMMTSFSKVCPVQSYHCTVTKFFLQFQIYLSLGVVHLDREVKKLLPTQVVCPRSPDKSWRNTGGIGINKEVERTEDGEAALEESGIRHLIVNAPVVIVTVMHPASVYLMLDGSQPRDEVGVGRVQDGVGPRTEHGMLQLLGFHEGGVRRTTVFLVST